MKKIITLNSILMVVCLAASAFAVDTKDDVVVYTPGGNTWHCSHTRPSPVFLNYATTTEINGPSYGTGISVQPLLGDIDGDGIDDMVITYGNVADANRMNWTAGHSVKTGDVGTFSTTTTSSMVFGPAIGSPGGVDVVIARFLADTNNDGADDAICVDNQFVNYYWKAAQSIVGTGLSKTTNYRVQYGLAGDTPLVGDFNGDGQADICVARNSSGSMLWVAQPTVAGVIQPYTPATAMSAVFGNWGDIPLVGDINGDGMDDIIVAENNGAGGIAWVVGYTKSDGTALAYTVSAQIGFGNWGDVPFVADINGDGMADIGVIRKSSVSWLKYQSVGFTTGTLGSGVLYAGGAGDRVNVQYGLYSDTTLIGQVGAPPADGANFYSITGDTNDDGKVNLTDLTTFAGNWLVDCIDTPANPACIY